MKKTDLVKAAWVFVALPAACSTQDVSSPPAPLPSVSVAAVSASVTAPQATATTAPPVPTVRIADAADGANPKRDAALTGPPCGDKPLPVCPLRAWMKANTSPAMIGKDFNALTLALDKIATFAPAGYPNWASIAKDGASAARSQDLDAVRAACRGCHTQYKDKYRKELRDRPI